LALHGSLHGEKIIRTIDDQNNLLMEFCHSSSKEVTIKSICQEGKCDGPLPSFPGLAPIGEDHSVPEIWGSRLW
jgi:hypothetical protein